MKNKKGYFIICLLIILGVVTTFTVIHCEGKSKKVDEEILSVVEKKDEPKKEIKEKAKFYLEIKGAVKKPGVYEVEEDNIINDVIKMAGNFTKYAYTDNINLSKKVSQEMVIYVYTKSQYKEQKRINQNVCQVKNYDISQCLDKKESTIILGNDINNKENEKGLININTADEQTLTTLSGIGSAKAKDIINYRLNNPFQKVEDIMNVSGIGPAVYEKIKPYITV